MQEFVFLIGVALVVVLLIVACGVARLSSSLLHPRARSYACSLVMEIYAYLSAPEKKDSFLLSLEPTLRERREMAEVVATLTRCVVECSPWRVRELVQAWQLEEPLVRRSLARGRRGRVAAMTTLLHLHPTADATARIGRHFFGSAEESFAQLLLVVYTSPRSVAELLSRHPHALSWDSIRQVVEVLKMRFARLPELEFDSLRGGYNVEMLALYLSSVEGVGSAREVAEGLTTHPNATLRTAAFNVLLGENLFPPLERNNIGS